MGDIVSLVEKASQDLDEKKVKEMEEELVRDYLQWKIIFLKFVK